MLVPGAEYFHFNGNWIRSEKFTQNAFTSGTTIYEVIRVINSVPLFLEDHLDRLTESASLINFKLWLGIEEIKQTIELLIKINDTKYGNIQILLNQLSDSSGKNFVCKFIPAHYPEPKLYISGVQSSIFNAVRENPKAKKINQALREATDKVIKENKVYEVILTDENNFITEGSRSNVFFVKGKNLLTPASEKVLAGITRKKIFEICEQNSIKITSRNISINELTDFNAAFFTGTSPKVLPINCIGRTRFSPSTPLVKKIIALYDQEIKNYLERFTIST